jgi:uncharacterized membrane protein
MKKLLATLAALMFAGATWTALAADEVKAGGPTDKPGRAAEAGKEGVKAGGPTDKPGRAAEEKKEEGAKTSGKKTSKKKKQQ